MAWAHAPRGKELRVESLELLLVDIPRTVSVVVHEERRRLGDTRLLRLGKVHPAEPFGVGGMVQSLSHDPLVAPPPPRLPVL